MKTILILLATFALLYMLYALIRAAIEAHTPLKESDITKIPAGTFIAIPEETPTMSCREAHIKRLGRGFIYDLSEPFPVEPYDGGIH